MQDKRNEQMAECLMGQENEAAAFFAAMDEQIPSPPTIASEDAIVLPQIQSMTEYIRLHYEKEIIEQLSNRIMNGDLSVCLQGRYYSARRNEDISPPLETATLQERNSRSVPSSYVEMYPERGSIVWCDYRRINSCTVEADLKIKIKVGIRLGNQGSIEYVNQRYRVDMWFDMEDGIVGDFGRFRLCRAAEENKPGVKLDEYLIPVFKWEDIEAEAENILYDTIPEGLHEPSCLKAEECAEKLGLSIVSYHLYKRPKTASILFFDSGKILIAETVDREQKPVEVEIGANTIVLNSGILGKNKSAVFHECFHYVEHRLFFLLQQMHNNDISSLVKWRPVTLAENKRSPIEWMEWQAHVGSLCLQVPQTYLKKRLKEELDGAQNSACHIGYRLQSIGRMLAAEYDVYNYQLRNRMIHIGCIAAKGALNYVDDGYIAPFVFSLSECRGGNTFVISPSEMIEEYVRNESFRKLIDSGRYIYVDGHICLNSPEYVMWQGRKFLLTPWANTHVDQCCLRFARKYIRDKQTHYVFGQLNSDEEYNGRSLSMSASAQAPRLFEQAKKTSQLLFSLPGSFHQTFAKLMEMKDIKVEKLAEETMMSNRSITRYRTEERNDYSADSVTVLCIGIHLDPLLSFDLMQKAGILLRNTPEDLTLKAILMGMYMSTVEQVREYLNEIDYPRIKLWPSAEAD